MGLKTGIQRVATVIRWVSFTLIAFGLATLLFDEQHRGLSMGVVFGGLGLVLAYIIDGFGRKED